MLRDIYIIRHGDAYEEGFGRVDDIDRNLNIVGIKEAQEIGDCLSKNKVSFDLIYSSSASRATQTALIFARKLNFNLQDLIIKNELYLASVDTLLETIKNAPDHKKSIAIFSHNPGISDLAWKKQQLINVATCGVVHFQVDVEHFAQTTIDNLDYISYGCPETFPNII